jgi:hypothetical protein
VHASGGDGSEYLRASEQAINIFVEALDLDIEAAQIANEAQLSALIARGAVESAVQPRAGQPPAELLWGALPVIFLIIRTRGLPGRPVRHDLRPCRSHDPAVLSPTGWPRPTADRDTATLVR